MNKPDARLVLLHEEHSGRDEMNLAGNPFALLQAASRAGQTNIYREWQQTLATGRTVTASWSVNGDARLGLPGPQDELLYLVLLQISREQKELLGEWPQTVHFSRRNLLERMGMQDGAKEYRYLKDYFARLQAVSIRAQWSFWDARVNAPLEETAFNLIDSYKFYEEKTRRKSQGDELPLSEFSWSKVVYNSLCAGNVRSLALDFTISLELAITRKMFRVLELLRHSKKPALSEVKLELFDLRDRLGMTSYPYVSKIKEKIAPAIDELKERGYLASVKYEKIGKVEKAVFSFEKVKMAPMTAETLKVATNGQDRIKTASENNGAPVESVEQRVKRGFEIYNSLTPDERAKILERARVGVQPIFYDRLENPDSPMCVTLVDVILSEYE